MFNVGSDAGNVQILNLAFRVRDAVPGTEVVHAPTDPDLRDYNVSFDKIQRVLGFRAEKSIDDGIREVLGALRDGVVDPEERRHYTLRQYVFLREAERAHRELSIDGQAPRPVKSDGAMAAKVEFYRHQLGEDEAASWRRVLETLFLTLGPQVAAFEQELGRFLVRDRADATPPHVVGTNACSMGLLLALRALDVGPGDEVITTPMTFAATANAILHLGATPKLVDVEPRRASSIRPPCARPSVRRPWASSRCTSTGSSPT